MSDKTDWVLMPREPTQAMLSAAHFELCDKPFSNNSERSERVYAAMLAAAPQPPAEAQVQGDRMAIKMLVAAGYVTEAKANEALNIANGFDRGPLEQAQGGGGVCETCDGAGHVVTYADPYDRGDVSSPEQSPCPACTAPPSGGLCVERTGDPDFPQWDAVKRLIEPAPPSAPVGVEEWLIGDLMEAEEGGHTAHTPAELCGLAAKALKSLTAQQPAAVDGAIAGWIADGDTIPDYLIEATRDAIRLEFGNNGTDGYYKRILVRVFRALAAQPAAVDGVK